LQIQSLVGTLDINFKNSKRIRIDIVRCLLVTNYVWLMCGYLNGIKLKFGVADDVT